jgi:hypothetical protein
MQIRLSPTQEKLSVSDLENRIQNRVYDLYQRRGCADGKVLDDWLEAKAEVLGVVAPTDVSGPERKAA